MTTKYQLFINGEWVDPAGGEWINSTDPYREEVWAEFARGGAADVDAAVKAARIAVTQGPWAQMTGSRRGAIMRNIGDLVLKNAAQLVESEVRDTGKLLAEVQSQVSSVADCWHYFAGLADKIEGASIPIGKPGTIAMTTREPVGVVAALTAWNTPLWFAAVKCAPALAAGCAVVVKPSEFAAASTLEFAALLHDAGLPDGVFNVVTGFGDEVGAVLVDHSAVTKITFTGADTTGAKVYQTAARSVKRVSLELGGKSPNIVFADADLEQAAVGVLSGIFGAAGQMCSAGSRLLVQREIREQFTDKVVELAKGVRLGDPMDPSTNVGPIATPPQFKKILDYIEVAKQDGARCVLGGRSGSEARPGGGQFVEPTIFDNVTNDMRIAQEEVFGPILSIIEFEDENQAVELANDVDFGLVAGVWTTDLGRAMRMWKALEVGTVWINTYRTYSYMLPFGGMKRSGLGRENGVEAVNEYLETKSIVISTHDGAPANPFVMR